MSAFSSGVLTPEGPNTHISATCLGGSLRNFDHFSGNATLHPCGKRFSESSYTDLQLYTHGWAEEGNKMCEECPREVLVF